MGIIVIVGYKPKNGKEEELDALMKSHVERLRNEGFVTDRESVLMKSKDGTVIEVFEWKSKEAIESAHSNSEVLKMWEEYSEVCDYIPISELEETSAFFAEFSTF